jgi:hypothetical protein
MYRYKSNYDKLEYLCYNSDESNNSLYRYGCDYTSNNNHLGNFFSFFILYSNFLPISIYVSVEICNYFHAYSIEVDLLMCHAATRQFAKVRSVNMSADLGMVQHIFSDKTGMKIYLYVFEIYNVLIFHIFKQ